MGLREGGGNCAKNTLKEGETEKRGRGVKILKKGGELGQGMGALKRGLEPPYKLCIYVSRISVLRDRE